MSLRLRYLLAPLAGLIMAQPVPAGELARMDVPARDLAPHTQLSVNQQVANTIADHLHQSGNLHHYTIDVTFADGTADLNGTVADPMQRDEALRLAQGAPGVERVRDHLVLAGNSAVTQIQATGPALQEPAPLPPPKAQSVALTGPATEPVPIFQAPPPSPYQLNPPKMPPNAWPTYAPYNNYSRVAYPEHYPYQAWPYIGPVYPFPKIPLGWRKVTLEWQDGHWFYGSNSNSHCWWNLRYW